MVIGAESGAATGPIPAEARPQDGPQTGEARSKPFPQNRPLRFKRRRTELPTVRDLVAWQSIDFQAAADRVLNRNPTLYRRLA